MPIGASTFYPYMGDLLSGITGNAYFEKIRGSGSRQLIFLGGALLGGLIPALIAYRRREQRAARTSLPAGES